MVGLAAQIGGYLLRSSVTSEPLLLVADLLYALGWSLWTGVVVVLFVQIIPEVKRRQFKQMLDAYDAAQRDAARAGSEQPSKESDASSIRLRSGFTLRRLARGTDASIKQLRRSLHNMSAELSRGQMLGLGGSSLGAGAVRRPIKVAIAGG